MDVVAVTVAGMGPAAVAICALVLAASLSLRRGRHALGRGAVPVAILLLACALIAAPRLPPVAHAVAGCMALAALAGWLRALRSTPVADPAEEIVRSERYFREALSRSNISVFAQDKSLRYTWVYNPRVDAAGQSLLGKTAAELIDPTVLDEADSLKRKAIETGQIVNDTVALVTDDQTRHYFDMTVTPTFDSAGNVDGILCSAVDVTEMRLFEVRLTAMAAQLATAYQRFELALDNSPITVFEQGSDLRYSFIYNPPAGLGMDDFLGRTDADVFSERDARRLLAPKENVLSTGGRQSMEVELEVAGSPRYYEITVEARRDTSGAVVGLVGTALDLTERRQDERQIRLMLRELTHRSKNLLAVIQAMARKTASLSGDLDSFVSDFSLRLRAIAAAHDLLVSQSWGGADLRELLRASLSPTIDPDSVQIQLVGDPLTLTPDAAQNLGLAFHELTTNASKYGALSDATGRLRVEWEKSPDGISILWSETDGPKVVAPDRRGFGRILLERLVGVTLNGSVELDFRPEGLECRIRFPAAGRPQVSERTLGEDRKINAVGREGPGRD